MTMLLCPDCHTGYKRPRRSLDPDILFSCPECEREWYHSPKQTYRRKIERAIQSYRKFRVEEALWTEPQSLEELGALTARWLEGEFNYIPNGYSHGPDPETTELIPVLAHLNRVGFVTVGSQPGRIFDDDPSNPWGAQWASVEGFSDSHVLSRIRSVISDTDLEVTAYRTLRHRWPFRPRRERDALASTLYVVGGAQLCRSELALIFGGVSEEAFEEVLSSWSVTVFDPVRGRNDLLWPTLARL